MSCSLSLFVFGEFRDSSKGDLFKRALLKNYFQTKRNVVIAIDCDRCELLISFYSASIAVQFKRKTRNELK